MINCNCTIEISRDRNVPSAHHIYSSGSKCNPMRAVRHAICIQMK